MDLATIQDWTKGRRELVTTPDRLDAIAALATSLNGSEPPSAVAAMIRKAYGSHVEQGKVQIFWGVFCDAVRTFSPAQSRSIDLLYEMSNQSDVIPSDGSWAENSDSMICWRELRGLPFALYDNTLRSFLIYRTSASAEVNMLDYLYPYDHFPEELDESLEQAPCLLNGTRFAATLFERRLQVPGLNLPAQVNRFIEDGIESSYNDEHSVRAQEWKVLVPVATSWILIAGKPIWKMYLYDQGAGQNLHDKRIWNKPKWANWKERLRLLSEQA